MHVFSTADQDKHVQLKLANRLYAQKHINFKKSI